jgi:hypothetical protein
VEIYIICCVILVGMVVHILRLVTAHRSALETLNGFMSIYSAENSSVSASIPESSQLTGYDFSGPTLSIEMQPSRSINVRDASIAKFHWLRIRYKDVFSNLNFRSAVRRVSNKYLIAPPEKYRTKR